MSHPGFSQYLHTVITVASMLATTVIHAQDTSGDDPAGYVRWDSTFIQATADRLERKLGDKALVWETVGNYDGHSIYLVLRGRTGQAELHETESDVQIGVRGVAVSVIGGELVDGRALPRKQRRGTSIKGGQRRETSPGDLIHIPPGVAHQLIVDPAEPYMYLLFKLDEEPLNQ